ncbi:MAG: radical SAM protein [bacterium]
MNPISLAWLLPLGRILKTSEQVSSFRFLLDLKHIVQAQLALRNKRTYLPSLFAHYTVNSVCNLRCSYCYVHQPVIFPEGFSQTGLPLPRAQKVLKTLRQECVMLRLQGGEPLLYPDILELISYAKQNLKYWNVSLITNGLALLKSLKQCKEFLKHLDILTISLDQTRMMQYPDLMEQLIYFLPKLGRLCKRNKVTLTCNYTATWEELSHPDRVEKTIESYLPFFPAFYVTPVRLAGKTPLPLLRNSVQLNRKFSLGRFAGPAYPKQENVQWYQEHCDPKLKIKIDAEGGLIYPCENHATSIGSLETHTIKELWLKQPVQYPNESCMGCGKQRFRSYAFKRIRTVLVIAKNLRSARK